MADNFMIYRHKGENYKINKIPTTDAIVVALRLANLEADMVVATGNVRAGASDVQVFVHAGVGLVRGIKVADLRPGGDLWPLVQSIQTDGGADLESMFDTHWAGRLTDLLALCAKSAEYNFPDFRESFGETFARAFRKTIESATRDQTSEPDGK